MKTLLKSINGDRALIALIIVLLSITPNTALVLIATSLLISIKMEHATKFLIRIDTTRLIILCITVLIAFFIAYLIFNSFFIHLVELKQLFSG